MEMRDRWLPRIIAAAAVVLAVALSTLLPLVGQPVQTVLGYAVFWVPLLGAVFFGRSAVIALRFRPIDLLWGAGVGLLARALASSTDLLIYGASPLMGLPTGQLLVFTVLAVVAIGPFIEELFFRGLVLGATRRGARDALSTSVAIVASAVIFSLMHVITATTASGALATGLASLILGLGTGVLAATTNRLGGAIVAHMVFNGAIVLASLMAATSAVGVS